MATMKPSEVLDAVKRAAIQRTLKTSKHARERMVERGAQRLDIQRAAETATEAQHDSPGEKWRLLGGRDSEGDELNFVVSFDSGEPRVVTILSD